MIRLEGVSHSIAGPAGLHPALKNIDFTLERGEMVALMGPNGSGKSTLSRCLNGLLVPEKGSVTVDGLSTRSVESSAEIRRRVGMVFQDPSQQLVTWSVAEEIAFGPENLGAAPAVVKAAVVSGLRRWGLEELRGRRPHDLSGGQMAALAIASVMAMNPAYVVVDEPSSLLDRRGRAELRATLDEIRRAGDVGVLWVTQFPEEALLFDRLIVLSGGLIVADGDPAGILLRGGDLRKWGLEATPATLISLRLSSLGVPLARGHVTLSSLMKELESLGLNRSEPHRACETPRLRQGPPAGPALLKLESASFGYDGTADAVSGVSLEVRSGDCVGLTGPSGSGKSTLAFLAAGAVKPTSGAVVRPEGLQVGLAVQFPEEQFCVSTVAAEVELGLRGAGLSRAGTRERALKCLQSVGLDPSAIEGRSPLSLSEGEKRKVALASALACEGSLLVLDEPTLGLDGRSSDALHTSVAEHLRQGGAALIGSHSGDFLFRAAGALLFLDGGQAQGPITWGEALRGAGGGLELPEGQLPELAVRLGARPHEPVLGSIDAVAQYYAERLKGALSDAKGVSEDAGVGPVDGLESRARSGKWS